MIKVKKLKNTPEKHVRIIFQNPRKPNKKGKLPIKIEAFSIKIELFYLEISISNKTGAEKQKKHNLDGNIKHSNTHRARKKKKKLKKEKIKTEASLLGWESI